MKRFIFLCAAIAVAFLSFSQNPDKKSYSFCPSSPIVKDHQGNVYRTVKVGTQCWMAENLRCTTSPSGKKWIESPSYTASHPNYSAFFSMTENSRNGVLYSWAAAYDIENNVSDVQRDKLGFVRGICPQGWHLPDISEWDTLFAALGGHAVAGESMKMPSQQWNPHIIVERKIGGFSAMPVGAFTEDGRRYAGMHAYFWSSSNFSSAMAWCCILYDYKSEGYNYLDYKCYGHSVRCVKNLPENITD